MKEIILYVGGDDSNHAGKIRGEILVATFSVLEGDDEIVRLGNKRDYEGALRYMSERGRDWRFTVRAGDQYRHGSQNVPFVLPTLINHYLHGFRGDVSGVCAYVDGELKSCERGKFIETVMGLPCAESVSNVSVSGFVKKRFARGTGFSKRYECPKLVWAADSIANGLFRKCSISDLFSHRKIIVPYIDR